MEPFVYDASPLGSYLKDEGEEYLESWGAPEETDDTVDVTEPPPPDSPQFAPVGLPLIKKRFRNKIPNPLRVDTRQASGLGALHETYTKAITSGIVDRAGSSKFLEQFRYTIIASQLLTGHSILDQRRPLERPTLDPNHNPNNAAEDAVVPTSAGALVTAAGAVTLAWMMSWVYAGGLPNLTKKRVPFVTAMLILMAGLSHAYIRQQWLRFVRDQAILEIVTLVARSQDFDSAAAAAIALIQEVELVSRGYRISAPLPPVTRMEEHSQTRRCCRLRKVLRVHLAEAINKFSQVLVVTKAFCEPLDLEKYYDIYDISDLDISDAMQGFSDSEFEDSESLRSLKIAAGRFHVIRKILLCAFLSLEAQGDNSDFLKWSTAVEGLKTLSDVTLESYQRLQGLLSEDEIMPPLTSSHAPMSPGREKWRSQLSKLNSLSTGIRGLQAKFTLLREVSDRSLNEAEDLSELGPNLLVHYDSIGQDIKMLQSTWEEGRAALMSGIDRNEKRLSSLSTLFSPVSALSGLTTVDEGGPPEALRALTGCDSQPGSTTDYPRESEATDVFEAVALPARPKSMFTREERIVKMREDRERRELAREKAEASRGMLRELEMVINLRPKKAPPSNKPASRNATVEPASARASI